MVTLHVDGRPWGVTVSSVIPVTMDPPKLMVSLFSDSVAAQHILRSGVFGVSLLTTAHTLVARAQAVPRVPKFLDAHCQESDLVQHAEFGTTGVGSYSVDDPDGFRLPAPRVARAAHFACRVTQTLQVDDHVLLVGQVEAAHQARTSHEPLLYVGGVFATVEPLETGATSATASARRE